MQIAAEEKLEIRPCKFDSPWKFAAAWLPFLSSNYTSAIRDQVARSACNASNPFVSLFLYICIYVYKTLDLPGCPSKGNGRKEEGTSTSEGTRGDG